MNALIERRIVADLERRLMGPSLIQLVAGPRQVGNTTAVRMLEKRWPGPSHYAAADVSPPPAARMTTALPYLTAGLK